MKIPLFYVLCLSILNGCALLQTSAEREKPLFEKRWVRSTLIKPFVGSRRLHRMTPLLTEKYVYQGNGIDGIQCLSRVNGDVIWSRALKGGVEGGAQLAHRVIYFGANDGYFYALDADDGSLKWKFEIHSEGLSEPTYHEGVIYFLAGNNVAFALDAESGQQIWLYNRRDTSALSIRGGSKPTVTDKFVYLGFSDGYVVALNRSNGQLEWETAININKRFRDVDAGVVIDDDHLYVTSYDGGLYSLDAHNGHVIWSHDDGGFTTPVIEGKRLYYTTSASKVLAVEKLTGVVVWSKPTAHIATRPVLFKNMLLVGEFSGDLKALNLANGDLVTDFAPGRGVNSSLAVDESRNEVYFMSSEANLFALRLAKVPTRREFSWHEKL